MQTLTMDELRELLVKCWMVHDGMWFFQCIQAYGIEAANRLNKAAIQSLAPVEVRMVGKALGIKTEDVNKFDELRDVIDGMFQVVRGDFMDFTYEFPEENVMRWQIGEKCFAMEGMKRIGASDSYECGVFYRVMCWVESLGIGYTVEPSIEGCLLRETGECSGKVLFEFQEE